MFTALFVNKKRTPFDPKIFSKIGCTSEIANFISCQFHCHPSVTTNDPKAPQIGFDIAWLLHKNIPGREPFIGHIFGEKHEIRDSHNFCKKKR